VALAATQARSEEGDSVILTVVNIVAAVSYLGASALAGLTGRDHRPILAAWAGATALLFVIGLVVPDHSWTGFDLGAAAIAAWLLWRRRKRKRALRELGAKSRARLAALVRKARESAKPRPVLRPVPGGAR
jgi:hypothetical protein